MDLKVDPARLSGYSDEASTGIYVRAQYNDKWDSFDIAALDYQSLMTWLRSRGGDNPWAEQTVALLLGHEMPDVRSPD